MRDELLGYLLGALEPSEQQRVEEQLKDDPALRQDLATLERGLALLECESADCAPPAGLAVRTCRFVSSQTVVRPQTAAGGAARYGVGRWTMQDLVVAAGICIAATLLLFPAIQNSKFNARLAACQSNLRTIGNALLQYSSRHGNFFPNVTLAGQAATAGIFAPRLLDNGYLDCPQHLVCPGADVTADDAFQVPSCRELQEMERDQYSRLAKLLSGSYGYSLGHIQNGQYCTPRNQGRSTFAVLSDRPNHLAAGFRSDNHGSRGQNVWFEDGHVAFFVDDIVGDETSDTFADRFFCNDNGDVAAGTHPNDSVIGTSGCCPKLDAVSASAN
mgnify:FL=1